MLPKAAACSDNTQHPHSGRRVEYIVLDDRKTLPPNWYRRTDAVRCTLDLTKNDNLGKLTNETLDLGTLSWRLDKCFIPPKEETQYQNGLQNSVQTGVIALDVPSYIPQDMWWRDTTDVFFEFQKPYPGTLGIWKCRRKEEHITFNELPVLLRYVPDVVRLLEVEFAAIDYIDRAEDYVTHRIKVVKPIYASETVAEFDMNLNLLTLWGFCREVQIRSSVLLHHPCAVFTGGTCLDRSSEMFLLDEIHSIPRASPRRITLVEFRDPNAPARRVSPLPRKKVESEAKASATAPSASSERITRQRRHANPCCAASHVSLGLSTTQCSNVPALISPRSALCFKERLLCTSVLSLAMLDKFNRGYSPGEDATMVAAQCPNRTP